MMSDSIPEPVHEEAAFILKKARELVATMLQETDEQVRQQIIEAEAKGQQDGQEASKPQHEALQKLESVLHTELSQKGVIASMSLAKNLLLAEKEGRKELVVDLVAQALTSVKDADRIWLRVNPLDAPILNKHKNRLIHVLGRASDVDIRVDRSVNAGGVLIQTGSGVIDAQLETQLEEIERILGVNN
jgi:flagellar assembly protein FliH